MLAVASGLALFGLAVVLQATHIVVARPEVASVPLPVQATPVPLGYVMDHNGNLLAFDVPVYNIIVERASIPSPLWPEFQAWLASIGLNEEQAVKLNGGQRWLFRDVPADAAEAARRKQEALSAAGRGIWLGVETTWRRWYPHNQLAAHVLGFQNGEGEFSGGVHQVYSDFLTACQRLHPERTEPMPVPAAAVPFLPSPRGCDLVLTIDVGVQYAVEQVLREDAEKYGAAWGVALVMDPRDGALLSAASWPTFDLNRYAFVEGTEPFVNRISALVYESGSVIKPVTWAAAVDTGLVTDNTTFNDTGRWEYGHIVVLNADRRAHGPVTPEEVLARSLNVPTAEVATRMGPNVFYRYLTLFGFGESTEVDLAPELPGYFRQPGDPKWSLADLATNSFGQGLWATPVQVARAMAVLANGGYLVTPHVLAGFSREGTFYRVTWPRGRRVVQETTARTLTRWLISAVDFLQSVAPISGVTVAGKSGTAETYTEDENAVNVTFVGYYPAEAPRVLVLVAFGRPKHDAFIQNPVQVWASTTAYPTFVRLMQAIAPLLPAAQGAEMASSH